MTILRAIWNFIAGDSRSAPIGVAIAVIIVSVGAAYPPRGLEWSGLGALAAIVLVVLIGVAVRGPLTAIPENAMKMVVGIMLVSFGTYWSGEGLGIAWPGDDLAILYLAATYLATAGLLVAVMRATAARARTA